MRLLCVCTGNTCRSPMLAALIQDELVRQQLSQISVDSAGSAACPGEAASREAIACMAGRGLDLSRHRSRHIGEVELKTIDRFLCMTSSHAAALRSLGVPAAALEVVLAAQGGVPDPYGGSPGDYEACARSLAAYARELVAGLARPRP